MQEDHYSVYVILLDSDVLKMKRYTRKCPDHDPSLPCYYVGMTGLSSEERFENHKQGVSSNKYVKKHGIKLVPSEYKGLHGLAYDAAVYNEQVLAVELREDGHPVYWNGNDKITEETLMEGQEDSKNKMDDAAEKAREELIQTLHGLQPDQRKGADAVIDWFKNSYMDTGYKRLGRIVKDLE